MPWIPVPAGTTYAGAYHHETRGYGSPETM
jgi:hypothetical protein